jgi:hypothetical protein
LSPEALQLLAALAEKMAVNQRSVLELSIREKAKLEGVSLAKKGKRTR